MGKFNELLSKKIAGIPVLYIGAVAVAILAFVAWKINPKLSDEEGTDIGTDEVDQSDDVSSALNPDAYAGLSSNGTVTVTQPNGSSDSVDVVVETNDKWITKSVAFLVAQSLATGGDAHEALSKYVNGEQLSIDEGKLRDAAIARYGLPPESFTPGGTVGPTPPVVVPTKPTIPKRNGNPPTVHTVSAAGDNSYTEIAKLYYGRTDGPTIDLLQVANQKLGHAGPWALGTKVNIPVYTVPKYFVATAAIHTMAKIAAKNGISQVALQELNDSTKFPVKVGTRVRVH